MGSLAPPPLSLPARRRRRQRGRRRSRTSLPPAQLPAGHQGGSAQERVPRCGRLEGRGGLQSSCTGSACSSHLHPRFGEPLTSAVQAARAAHASRSLLCRRLIVFCLPALSLVSCTDDASEAGLGCCCPDLERTGGPLGWRLQGNSLSAAATLPLPPPPRCRCRTCITCITRRRASRLQRPASTARTQCRTPHSICIEIRACKEETEQGSEPVGGGKLAVRV